MTTTLNNGFAAWLAECRARCEAATPGPWQDDGEADFWSPEDGYATSWVRTGLTFWSDPPTTGAECAATQADAAFMAHARTDLPKALDIIEALAEQLQEQAKEIAELKFILEGLRK